MSQKKVDEYRESKKSRKEQIAKQKRDAKIRKLVGWCVLCLVIVGLVTGIVITVVNSVKAKTESEAELYNESNYILEDYADIEGTATEAETAEESAEAAE